MALPRRFYVCQAAGKGVGRGPAALMTGQLPLFPVVLAAGGACGAVADGGLSAREGKGRGILGGNQRRRSAAGTFSAPQAPTKEGLDRSERTRTIRQDSSKTERWLLQPERSEARAVSLGACWARPEPRVFRLPAGVSSPKKCCWSACLVFTMVVCEPLSRAEESRS